MDKQKFLALLDKHIDQQGLAKDLAFELVVPFLQKFAADSANPYDDKLVEWVKEYIEKNGL